MPANLLDAIFVHCDMPVARSRVALVQVHEFWTGRWCHHGLPVGKYGPQLSCQCKSCGRAQ